MFAVNTPFLTTVPTGDPNNSMSVLLNAELSHCNDSPSMEHFMYCVVLGQYWVCAPHCKFMTTAYTAIENGK